MRTHGTFAENHLSADGDPANAEDLHERLGNEDETLVEAGVDVDGATTHRKRVHGSADGAHIRGHAQLCLLSVSPPS